MRLKRMKSDRVGGGETRGVFVLGEGAKGGKRGQEHEDMVDNVKKMKRKKRNKRERKEEEEEEKEERWFCARGSSGVLTLISPLFSSFSSLHSRDKLPICRPSGFLFHAQLSG